MVLFVVKEMSTDSSKQVKLGFLAGLVPRERSMAFERILFRATRGNVFLRQVTVEDAVTDPVSGEKVLVLVPHQHYNHESSLYCSICHF